MQAETMHAGPMAAMAGMAGKVSSPQRRQCSCSASMSISSAIANLKLLGFEYSGFARVVEPHTYGIDSNGLHTLRAYQVRGGSKSKNPSHWRMFHEKDMKGVTVLHEGFLGARPDYKRGDRWFRTIIAQL
jgi:hypothetical protein